MLNEVVLNQALVSFGDDETTSRVIQAVQAEGTCWCGGTVWKGHKAMRVSVSSRATTDSDVKQPGGGVNYHRREICLRLADKGNSGKRVKRIDGLGGVTR